jgi:hypothetical protein
MEPVTYEPVRSVWSAPRRVSLPRRLTSPARRGCAYDAAVTQIAIG